MRTDEQIVMETNDLARLMLSELVGTGYEAPEGHKFWEAKDPRSQKAWAAAVKAMELITKTEVEDALNNYLADLEANRPRRYKAPNDLEVTRIAETVPCSVGIIGIKPDGTPLYDNNGSIIDWDGQRPVRHKGKFIFLDDIGNEWTFDQLTMIKEDADGDA